MKSDIDLPGGVGLFARYRQLSLWWSLAGVISGPLWGLLLVQSGYWSKQGKTTSAWLGYILFWLLWSVALFGTLVQP